MPWRRQEPGHQQPWYWPNSPGRFQNVSSFFPLPSKLITEDKTSILIPHPSRKLICQFQWRPSFIRYPRLGNYSRGLSWYYWSPIIQDHNSGHLDMPYFSQRIGATYLRKCPQRSVGWGLLNQFPPFRYFSDFFAIKKNTGIVYHFHIW